MREIDRVRAATAGIILVSFFLPWGQLFGASASAFDATKLGSYANWLWLIPGLAAATIANELLHERFTVFPVLASIAPLYVLLFAADKSGGNVFHFFAIGAYLTFACAIALLLYELGLIKSFMYSGIGSLSNRSKASSGFKKCPACAEQVRAEALVCRFCQHKLTSNQVAATPSGIVSP
jgi:hypothetical protein